MSRVSRANRLLEAWEPAQPSGHRAAIKGLSTLVCPGRSTLRTLECRGEQQQWPCSTQQVIEQASTDLVIREACAEIEPTASSKPAKTAFSAASRFARVFAIGERNPTDKFRPTSRVYEQSLRTESGIVFRFSFCGFRFSFAFSDLRAVHRFRQFAK